MIPKLQLNYSPNKLSTSKINKDSIEIDLDTTSLFATNRYSGKDLHEKGLWLNSGIEYENRSLNGKKFGYEIGQIFRVDKINQFSSNFIGPNDGYFTEVFGSDIMKQIELTRIEILNLDILRGVIIILVCFIILYLSQKKIIKY